MPDSLALHDSPPLMKTLQYGFVALILALTIALTPLAAQAKSIKIEASGFDYFNLGSSNNQNGKLTFIGGLELEANHQEFGGFSGLRISSDGSRLFAVTDGANWLTGKLIRNKKTAPIALADADFTCLCRKNGKPYGSKHWGDAEGLEISGNTAFVAFERLNRINQYNLSANHTPGPPSQATASFKPFKIEYNEGLEAVALAPAASPLAGKFIAIAEKSLNANGNHRGFIATKGKITEFSIVNSHDYSVTDAVFLPNGDLLILERRAGFSIGIGMRIRKFGSKMIKAGALLKGEIMMEAGLSSRIDNMEGISTWQTPTGKTRIVLISDDNFSRLQRTLLLEFEVMN